VTDSTADFRDLMRLVPPSANAILVIDVNAVHISPIAVREGWKDRHEAAYVKRPLILPPEADRIVVAAQLNAGRQFAVNWELAVMSLTEPMSVRAIARAEGGYVDTINGLQSVWTPSNAYFIRLDAKTMGVMSPANRQAVSRWAQFGRQNTKNAVSSYLETAASYVGAGTQIVLAIDLKDVVQPHKVRQALKESGLLKNDAVKQREWEKVISSIQGLTMKVHLGKTATGTLQVDFAESPALFGSQAKQLVTQSLERFDANIEDLSKWRVTIRSHSVILKGPLTTSNMRRLFSLLEVPTSKFSSQKDQKPTDDKSVIAKASQNYYKSTTALMDDLRKTLKDRSKRHHYAVWYERFGRRIDRLPILNVDQELLAWGASISATFRTMSVSERMAGIRSGVRKSNIYGSYQYNYNNNGYYSGGRSSGSARQAVTTQERARASQVRFRSWKQIDDSIAGIRQQMTRKYKVRF